MKRYLSILVALTLCFGLCVSGLATTLPIAEEKLTLTMLQCIRDIDNIDLNDNWALAYLEELTNVHIERELVKESNWSTKLTLALASGNLPDIIWSRIGIDAEEYGVVQGLVVPLDDLIDQYMPNLKERVAMNESALNTCYSSDGHIYGIPSIYISNNGDFNNGHNFIQQTWLDTLGISMPTTVDELTDVLRAFKTGDPNGNGIADEIPYSATFTDGSNASLFLLFNFWGIPTDGVTFFSIDENAQVAFDPYRPGFRAALEWMNLLYNEKLMDVESLTQNVPSLSSKIAENIVGFFPHWRLTAMKIDAAAETCTLMLPVAAEGFVPQMNTKLSMGTPSIYLTRSNQHLEETARWLDAQLETDTMFSMYRGEIGTNWKYDDNGKITTTNAEDWSKLYMDVDAFVFMPAAYYTTQVNIHPAYVEKGEYCAMQKEAGVTQPYPNTLLLCASLSADDSNTISLLKVDIQTAVNEFVSKSITGGVTEESWNAFMSNCSKLRIDEYLSIYQPALDAYLAGK